MIVSWREKETNCKLTKSFSLTFAKIASGLKRENVGGTNLRGGYGALFAIWRSVALMAFVPLVEKRAEFISVLHTRKAEKFATLESQASSLPPTS